MSIKKKIIAITVSLGMACGLSIMPAAATTASADGFGHSSVVQNSYKSNRWLQVCKNRVSMTECAPGAKNRAWVKPGRSSGRAPISWKDTDGWFLERGCSARMWWKTYYGPRFVPVRGPFSYLVTKTCW